MLAIREERKDLLIVVDFVMCHCKEKDLGRMNVPVTMNRCKS